MLPDDQTLPEGDIKSACSDFDADFDDDADFDADDDDYAAEDDNERDGWCFSSVSAAASNCKTSRPLSLLTFNCETTRSTRPQPMKMPK